MKPMLSDLLVVFCLSITAIVSIRLIYERKHHREELISIYNKCTTKEHSAEAVNVRLRWKK